ncbi:hypothetical protein ACIBP6_07110 [Nonomuraea terrae]|uniref:hypothetical protein n=1 Tax=Nonomuraea terrae TaxID=2530383 RepID=UPI003790D90E
MPARLTLSGVEIGGGTGVRPRAELAASIERQQRMREELAGMELHPGSVDGHRVDVVEVDRTEAIRPSVQPCAFADPLPSTGGSRAEDASI